MAWGPFYQAKLPSSDTIWAQLSPDSDLIARIAASRWLGYVWDYLCYYVIGYYPQRHYKLSLAVFLFILAICLYLLQAVFLPLFEGKLRTPIRKTAFYALTGLCFVNVLFSELLYFTESFGIFQFSLLFCMLGCLSFTRGHYVRGMISFLIMVCFYQMGAPIAALVLCTWLILRYRCRFSKELLVKELLYIAAPRSAQSDSSLEGCELLTVEDVGHESFRPYVQCYGTAEVAVYLVDGTLRHSTSADIYIRCYNIVCSCRFYKEAPAQ